MKVKEVDLDKFKSISKTHKLKIIVIYTYSLLKQPKSKAVRFVYCLKGRRDEEGLIAKYKGKFLAPGCFLIPIEYDKEMQSVFRLWGIPFKNKVMLTN
jgi:hypothetical protein